MKSSVLHYPPLCCPDTLNFPCIDRLLLECTRLTVERLLLCLRTKLNVLLWNAVFGTLFSGVVTNPEGFLRHLFCSRGKIHSLI